jgi:4-hydroxybenzoate polyprenyltransferase
MDAAWAAAYGQIFFAMLIAMLLPLSLWLAKRFAVT